LILEVLLLSTSKVYRPYSKSWLTLNEWRFNPSCQCCFWIAGGWVVTE
jgi:hypothetical protein